MYYLLRKESACYGQSLAGQGWPVPHGADAFSEDEVHREEASGLCRKGWQLDMAETPAPAVQLHLGCIS